MSKPRILPIEGIMEILKILLYVYHINFISLDILSELLPYQQGWSNP